MLCALIAFALNEWQAIVTLLQARAYKEQR
jgi:hypothetical protein